MSLQDKVDEVEKRTTIEFPEAVDRTELEGLFAYLARELPADVYFTPYAEKCFFGFHTDMPAGVQPRVLEEKVHGTIDTGYINGFSCHPSPESIGYFTSIIFGSIPGYSLKEHPQAAVDLWDRVRGLTEQYFKESEQIKPFVPTALKVDNF